MGGVRAVLVLGVGLLWLGCLAGAVGFTGYAGWLARRWRTPASAEATGGRAFARAVVIVSAVYAAVMAIFAVILAGLVLAGPEPGSASEAAKWAAIPSWSAAAAAVTSLLQLRRLRSVA